MKFFLLIDSIIDRFKNKTSDEEEKKNLLQYLGGVGKSEEPNLGMNLGEAVTNSAEALTDFHRRYKEKPGPHASNKPCRSFGH